MVTVKRHECERSVMTPYGGNADDNLVLRDFSKRIVF